MAPPAASRTDDVPRYAPQPPFGLLSAPAVDGKFHVPAPTFTEIMTIFADQHAKKEREENDFFERRQTDSRPITFDVFIGSDTTQGRGDMRAALLFRNTYFKDGEPYTPLCPPCNSVLEVPLGLPWSALVRPVGCHRVDVE